MVENQIKADPAATALAAAGAALAFYAMPDFVRPRTLRFIGKTLIIAAASARALRSSSGDWPNSLNELRDSADSAGPEGLALTAGIAAAVGGAGTAATIMGEKAVFRRAEKKRAAGRRLPHTTQALLLAALTGGLVCATESAEIS